MITLTLPATVFNAMRAIAPKKDMRYYLHGVAVTVTPYGVTYRATDGHRLLEYRPPAQDFDVTGDATYIVSTAGLKGTFSGDVAIELGDDNAATVRTGAASHTCEIIDGRFPDCDRVTEDVRWSAQDGEPLAQTLAFNPAYLADVSKALKADVAGIVQPGNSCAAFAVSFDWATYARKHRPVGELRYLLMPVRQ